MQWAAPALAPLIIVAAIPIILVSPDAALDLAFMANDLRNGDYASFYLNAVGLMIPGVTGLGMLSKADELYDGYRLLNNVDNISDSRYAINYTDNWIDDAAGSACFNSFSADTTVVTDEGNTPIHQIEIGDYVLAWNEFTDEISFEKVTDTIHHTDEVVVYLTIDGEEIETTPEHPFYVEGAGWTDAEDLQLGDEIRNADGETGEIESITIEEVTQEMYNLTVDEAHTFFVGDGQWLVHNACDFYRIPYGSDELSRAVQQFRIDWNLPGKNTNVAVFNMNGHLPSKLINDIYAYPEILRLDGNLIIAKNIEGGPHSEDIILQLLKSNNVNRTQVMSVYSELSPCIGCSNKLNNFSKYGSDLPVAFSFMYPSEVYLKYKAVEILLKRKYTGVILP